MIESENYYTAAEVADLLRVSVRTVRRLCESDTIKCIQVGSQYRISETDLKNFIKDGGKNNE